MDNFIPLLSVSQASELAVLRARLEFENIHFRIRDELTTQIQPFYSNAIGGIKLEVIEADYNRALEIIADAGFKVPEEPKIPAIMERIGKFTSRIPLLKKLSLELRFLLSIALIILAILGSVYLAIYLVNLPTRMERLTGQTWCIDRLLVDGKKSLFSNQGLCNAELLLHEDGSVYLNQPEGMSLLGQWQTEGDSLFIYNFDSHGDIFNGRYYYELETEALILNSEHTAMICHPEY